MEQKRKKNNAKINIGLVQIEGRPGVYTSTESFHSCTSINFSELSDKISNALNNKKEANK